jgi:predicted SAM-dependent methyltransferase
MGKHSKRAKLHKPTSIRLDLACGDRVEDGFEGVDLHFDGARHRFDLLAFPWPVATSSCEALRASHFVEHIPMLYVGPRGDERARPAPGYQDYFLRFFEECHRVLKPGCWMEVISPCARHNRAFQDPTHRRFLVEESFAYLNKKWREENKLDHYLQTKANFAATVNHAIPSELSLRSKEVQRRAMNHEWNNVWDLLARLQAIKE